MCGDRSVPPDDIDPPAPDRGRSGDEAIAVDTYVSLDAGRWKVEIVVIFPDEAVRRTVNHYRTERQAEIAASWIKRAAQRDIEGPLHG
jgi:hypothetical protein